MSSTPCGDDVSPQPSKMWVMVIGVTITQVGNVEQGGEQGTEVVGASHSLSKEKWDV